MSLRISRRTLVAALVGLMAAELTPQSRKYEGPDDPAGDIAAVRGAYMTGNRVRLYCKNTTQLGDWPTPDASKWPDDQTGSYMVDGLALLLGGMVFLENDSIPVTDPAAIASRRDLDTLWFVETSYATQGVDQNPQGTIDWGLYPVFGYFNELNDYVAISNRPESWPTGGWPARGDQKIWPGEWNGRFGRGVQYAALETFFVANDAQDQEYLQPGHRVKYYPRPGVKIGYKLPTVTIQKGFPWGGLGLRVEVRGYQWNNPQTRDAIFWEYSISNISDYDIPFSAFGCWLDNGIGGGPTDDFDDIGFYDKYEDLAYSWDINGVGAGGLKPGIMGWAFLESPGIIDDNVDNDEDGIIDEKRDNPATAYVGAYDGIADVEKFLKWYILEEDDLKPHWDADEDQDWRDGSDVNENGVYDSDEDAGDDLGLDGVGPNDLNYNGPDQGECNHQPDYVEGLGCEPNFAAVDISESDMIGLTAFRMIIHPQGGPPQAKHDRECWNVFAIDSVAEFFGKPSNLIEMFGSGQFRLQQGRTERISLSEVHAYEELAGLNSAAHSAPSLYSKKAIVQSIYENDYRFAQAPMMPALSAQAGDGVVVLSWDDAADKLTREPLLRGSNDFEGYKLYKATDKQFGDAELLYDGYGNPAGKKPIFQCDLKDGKKGFADFSLFNGLAFYLGEDTGIRHYFTDNNVQNGRTYYYALAAYDYGIEVFGKDKASILPSENNIVLDLDENEEIRFYGKNVQIVTPFQQASGYVPTSFQMEQGDETMIRSGAVVPSIMNTRKMKTGHTYKLKVQVANIGYSRVNPINRHPSDVKYTTTGFLVYDTSDPSAPVYYETPDHSPIGNFGYGALPNTAGDYWHLNEDGLTTDVFDGMQITIRPTVLVSEFDATRSGWVVGNAPITITSSRRESQFFPWQYDIIFTDSTTHTRCNTAVGYVLSVDNKVLDAPSMLLTESFNFTVINRTFPDNKGNFEKLDLLVHDVNKNGHFEPDSDLVLVGNTVTVGTSVRWAGTVFSISFPDLNKIPKRGDVYRVDFKRPFFTSDSILFTVKAPTALEAAKVQAGMEDIKVVPNPYVATNMMEPALSNPFLNQRRRLLFTHIPAECSIKIFTASGVLVDEIEVHNPAEQGTVHWDMLTKEDLEIAAGIYVYHVKSKITGDEKIGKFAVIK